MSGESNPRRYCRGQGENNRSESPSKCFSYMQADPSIYLCLFDPCFQYDSLVLQVQSLGANGSQRAQSFPIFPTSPISNQACGYVFIASAVESLEERKVSVCPQRARSLYAWSKSPQLGAEITCPEVRGGSGWAWGSGQWGLSFHLAL